MFRLFLRLLGGLLLLFFFLLLGLLLFLLLFLQILEHSLHVATSSRRVAE